MKAASHGGEEADPIGEKNAGNGAEREQSALWEQQGTQRSR